MAAAQVRGGAQGGRGDMEMTISIVMKDNYNNCLVAAAQVRGEVERMADAATRKRQLVIRYIIIFYVYEVQ